MWEEVNERIVMGRTDQDDPRSVLSSWQITIIIVCGMQKEIRGMNGFCDLMGWMALPVL